jgi:probable HAF family extracellular repeat protein
MLALAHDINDAGEVAGSWVTREGNFGAFYSTGHRLIDLGPGDGYAINDSGQVAGSRWRDGELFAFYTVDGAIVELGQGVAYDINNQGQVVGVSNGHPFLYDGMMHDLGTLDGGGFAYGINEAGQIVGESEWGIPWLYDAAGLHDLHATITAASNGAYYIHGLLDINNHGEVIGVASPAAGGTGEAFAYNLNSGAFRVLPQLIAGDFTYPGGINDNGDIVGWARPSGTSGTGAIHAVLWSGSAVRDLGTLGGGSSAAYAINNEGVVTGGADKRSGAEHVFRLYTSN